MSDLGNIQYTNVNAGTRVVDRTQEARAIDQGLGAAKKVIDDTIIGGVTDDMNEALEDQAAASASLANELPPEMQFPEGSTEAYLENRVERLQAVIAQGQSSARTSAQMQIQGILADAKVNYPWLYDKLQARASSVMAGSQEMTQLGIDDSLRTSAAQTAQDQYDALVKDARAEFPKGLGIPESIPINSPEFKELYAKRSHLRNNYTTNQVLTTMDMSNAQYVFNNPVALAALNEQIFGETGSLQGTFQKMRSTYKFWEVMEQVNKGSKGNLEFINNWALTYGEPWKQELVSLKAKMQAGIENIEPAAQVDPRGQNMVKTMKDRMAIIDNMISTVNSMQGNVPSAIQQLDTSMAVLRNSSFQRLPESGQAFYAWIEDGPGKAIIEIMAEAKNPEGINLLNNIALASQSFMKGSHPEFFDPTHPEYMGNLQTSIFHTTGSLNLPDSPSSEEVTAGIRDRLSGTDPTFIMPTRNNEEMTIAALKNMEEHKNLWAEAKRVIPNAGADYANNALLGTTYSLEYLNSNLDQPKNADNDVLRMLSDGTLDTAVDVSLENGPSGERNAFAVAASEFYAKTKPEERKQEMRNMYRNDRLFGTDVTLAQVVKVDVTALERGEFKYKIDNEALKPVVARLATRGRVTGSLQRAQDLVNEKMNQIQQEMQQQIQIEMLLNRARSVDGTNFSMQDDWLNHYLGQGNAEPESAWAYVFNHTKEGSVSAR